MTKLRQSATLNQNGLILAVAVVYAVLARLGLLLAIHNTNTSPVWPPSGFAFAAVLIFGRRVWSGITIGAFVANLTSFLAHPPAPIADLVTASAVISIGNTLEAVAGSLLVDRFMPGRNPLDEVGDVVRFVIIAVVLCLIAGTMGPISLCLLGVAPWKMFLLIWSTWWMGDTTGVLIIAPMLLAWRYHAKTVWTPDRIGELVAVALVGLFVIGLLFGPSGSTDPLKSMSYLVLPPLLWLVFRFQPREALTMATLVSVVAVRETALGNGAFVRGPENSSLELLQAFVSVITITVMLLGAACAERTRAEKELEDHANREHKIATTLQEALQPKDVVDIPGITSSVYYKAALDEASVGGDFYDMFRISNMEYAIVIGDISGKGLAAAIQVTAVRNMLRSLFYLRTEVAAAVTELNAMIDEYSLLHGFTTVFAGIYNVETNEFTYVSCGHEIGFHYRRSDHQITELTPTGPPLGVAPDFRYTRSTHTLSPGDVLLLLTDGLSEARVKNAQLLGCERVGQMLFAHAPTSTQAHTLVDAIVADVEKALGEPFRDDVCLIAFSVS